MWLYKKPCCNHCLSMVEFELDELDHSLHFQQEFQKVQFHRFQHLCFHQQFLMCHQNRRLDYYPNDEKELWNHNEHMELLLDSLFAFLQHYRRQLRYQTPRYEFDEYVEQIQDCHLSRGNHQL